MKSEESGPGAYLELLAELKSALEEMRSATRDQLEALKAGDRQGIWEAVYRQEDLILRLADLEERRGSLQAALEEELGLPAGAPLSEVLLYLPEEEAAACAGLHARLRNVLLEIKELNFTCALLAKRALYVNGRLLEISGGTAAAPGLYGPGGQPRAGAPDAPPLMNASV